MADPRPGELVPALPVCGLCAARTNLSFCCARHERVVCGNCYVKHVADPISCTLDDDRIWPDGVA